MFTYEELVQLDERVRENRWWLSSVSIGVDYNERFSGELPVASPGRVEATGTLLLCCNDREFRFPESDLVASATKTLDRAFAQMGIRASMTSARGFCGKMSGGTSGIVIQVRAVKRGCTLLYIVTEMKAECAVGSAEFVIRDRVSEALHSITAEIGSNLFATLAILVGSGEAAHIEPVLDRGQTGIPRVVVEVNGQPRDGLVSSTLPNVIRGKYCGKTY